MRIDLLKKVDEQFYTIYPKGFKDEEMVKIKKKHKVEKLHNDVHEMFAKEQFKYPSKIVENMVKIISRSTLVSLFEKPKFKDFALSLSDEDKIHLSEALYNLLHGSQEIGFNQMLDILSFGKLAKWSLITVIPYYFSPTEELFIKPTTTKNIIKHFELDGVVYKPKPSYQFYVDYKKLINEMKSFVSPELGKDNAAFSGILMMMMEL